jgi:hypothetical protein
VDATCHTLEVLEGKKQLQHATPFNFTRYVIFRTNPWERKVAMLYHGDEVERSS